MAVEAANEALWATEDLVSETKMEQLFKLQDLWSNLQCTKKVFVCQNYMWLLIPKA